MHFILVHMLGLGSGGGKFASIMRGKSWGQDRARKPAAIHFLPHVSPLRRRSFAKTMKLLRLLFPCLLCLPWSTRAADAPVRDVRFRYLRNFTPEVARLAPNAYKAKQYPAWNLIQQLHTEGKLNAVQEALCAGRMPGEELYDPLAGPHEIKNLAASTDPEHQAARRRWRAELEKRIAESNDQGREHYGKNS